MALLVDVQTSWRPQEPERRVGVEWNVAGDAVYYHFHTYSHVTIFHSLPRALTVRRETVTFDGSDV
ncbi:hypothetical protein DPMN_012456 [Dreissena polymorpha]|uniref:Uncharacterized protein n=1 Tax=Dreissena polymorpha TaxID=45954 RepID=A0A9D4S1D6_DREPO|nr:hypothetical protein DPMN_012456 [Dreissena polymorpha]